MRTILRFIKYGWFPLVLLLTCPFARAADDITVVVSIKPVHALMTGLMKGVATPELLIDGSQTPYDFTLNQAQRDRLTASNLFIWVGKELEQSLQQTVSELPDSVEIIELLAIEDMKILPSRQNPDERDPFFWMDDRNMIILLEYLTRKLVQKDPARSHIYSRNRREMLKPLTRIDREYEYGYRGLKAGLAVMYFDTLRYFEQAYALKTLGQVTGTPHDIEQAINLFNVRNRITNREAICLLIDKSMPPRNLELLTKGQTINIGELDVMGLQFDAGSDLYIKLMEYNTDIIKQCLNANMSEAALARQSASADDQPVVDGVGGRFILTDHLGDTVTELDMRGQFSLINFGYTFCPDICPTGLQVLSGALTRLGGRGEQIQPYFITVDPDRDSVKVLNKYVNYFHPRLIGLTGSKQMIQRVADQFKVKFQKVKNDQVNTDKYTMDHSASIFLMAPDGRFITKFAHGINAETLAEELASIIR